MYSLLHYNAGSEPASMNHCNIILAHDVCVDGRDGVPCAVGTSPDNSDGYAGLAGAGGY